MAREYEEDLRFVKEKVARLAALISSSSRLVVHTGAGISTSASIPDFRGPNGVWTREKQRFDEREELTSVAFEEAVPTRTHMALVQLYSIGRLQLLVTQNVDGLHRRSGIPRDALAEIHGCIYDERCPVCGLLVTREFDVNTNDEESEAALHRTGRYCTAAGCPGELQDTIVHFGESLREPDAARAEAASRNADLAICLGTSLSVRPASEYPMHTVRAGGRFAVVNMQETPLDKFCDVRIFARTDLVFDLLLEALQLPIPRFELSTSGTVILESLETAPGMRFQLLLDDAAVIEKVLLRVAPGKKGILRLEHAPFLQNFDPMALRQRAETLQAVVHFSGFGGKQPETLTIPLPSAGGRTSVPLRFSHVPEGKVVGAAKRARRALKLANEASRRKKSGLNARVQPPAAAPRKLTLR